MTTFAVAEPDQRDGALQVWRAANVARGNPPSASRVVRVREKLEEDSVCVVVALEHDQVVGMALAEPGRQANGQGVITPGLGHVSMVFVDPGRWGRGIGTGLLNALHHMMRERGWRTSSLWTRSSNQRGRRPYESCQYRDTGDIARLGDGDEIVRYELELDDAAAIFPSGPSVVVLNGPAGVGKTTVGREFRRPRRTRPDHQVAPRAD
jgi:GNAT superfamily N-acetyltransferase